MQRFPVRNSIESREGILITDALHATFPNLYHLKILNMGYILGVKPGSHEKLFGQMDQYKELGQMQVYVEEAEIGDKIKKKRIREYHCWNGVLLNHRAGLIIAEIVEYVDLLFSLPFFNSHVFFQLDTHL